jgi:hypothetical protein
VLVTQYQLGISSLFRSIDKGFRDRFTPVDACTEDVEEESFELVDFGHDGICTVQGKSSKCGIKVVRLSQVF